MKKEKPTILILFGKKNSILNYQLINKIINNKNTLNINNML